MKKLLMYFCTCICANFLYSQNKSITLYSQDKSITGGLYKHVIDVEAYGDWGRGYLTVIDNHCVTIENTRYLTAFEPVLYWNYDDGSEAPKIPNEAIPEIGCIIYEVNGKPTLGMTPDDFYRLTDTAMFFTLKFEDVNRNIITYEYSRYLEKGDIFGNYSIPFPSKDDDPYELGLPGFMSYNNMIWAFLYSRYEECGNIINEVSDENYDFHNAQTYDYQIMGNDQLMDKKILDEIDKGDMVRDTEHPDLLFTIKKNLEGNIYLELAALDAKKQNSKINQTPVVWKMIVQRERRKNENVLDAYMDYAGWAGLPWTDRLVVQKYPLYKTSGIEINEEKVVTKVYDNALCSFLQKGDKLLKIESYRYCQYREINDSHSKWFEMKHKDVFKNKDVDVDKLDEHVSFHPHWKYLYFGNEREYRDIDDYIIVTYKRGKQTMKNIVRPERTLATRRYLLNKKSSHELNSKVWTGNM